MHLKLKDYVLYIPANRDAKALKYRGSWDKPPKSIHVCNAYDPVVDLDAFLVTYGISRELDTLSGDKRFEVLRNIVGLDIMTIATLYHRRGFEELTRYDTTWFVLGKTVFVIDAEGKIVRTTNSAYVVDAENWLKMGQGEKLRRLTHILGDILRAQAALEYILDKNYTGCHLHKDCTHAPYGIILVIDVKYVFPATNKILQILAGKDKVNKPAWLRPARLIPKSRVLEALLSTPALLTHIPILEKHK